MTSAEKYVSKVNGKKQAKLQPEIDKINKKSDKTGDICQNIQKWIYSQGEV